VRLRQVWICRVHAERAWRDVADSMAVATLLGASALLRGALLPMLNVAALAAMSTIT
jgi:hypothetical protein